MRLFASLFVIIAALYAASSIMSAEARQGGKSLPAAEMSSKRIAWFQVRVTRRVVIRLPSRPPSRRPAQDIGKRPKEKKIGKCVSMNRLIAAQPGSGKEQYLNLITKNRQTIRAYLGNGCLAREFYAGTYMERSRDGMLCTDRDLVYARTGGKCEIEKFRQLVAR